MIACPGCGAENPERAKFCMECAAPLGGPPPITEERKTVTTLFCDLVAFTAMSEAADPEDVDSLLGEYFARATRAIESHGGTIEKFIGDAVVGVFGVPALREDDPERAVRAGLRIVEAFEGMTRPDGSPLQVRVGVNTGEALVHLDVTPGSGEGFLTGDAVNTAARLQSAAPPMDVAVGALTHELTTRAIEYEALQPVVAKGKIEPVLAWRAVRPVGRTGIRTRGRTTTPFLGRGKELAFIADALAEAERTRQAQFVLVVGEAGIGKSRLVLEFAHCLEERPGLVTWRQGRCLPYGEGVAFAALSEILKAQSGILDSDDIPTVESKLEAILPADEDRDWLRQRLRPLLGLEAAEASREENFAAWTRFLTHVASCGPTVFVIEDLHWAGEGMLDFVAHLGDQAPSTPLLVLATARPELLHRRPDLLDARERVSRIMLSPLTRKEADRLVSALVDQRLGAAVRAPILERAGGNPLYAEEYVRLLLDRGVLLKTHGLLQLKEGEELPLPDTVQAILAARLDTLPPGHKALLCDAAVFGESFWGSGVAALAGRSPGDVQAAMALLIERQLVRPVASSSLAGEGEYLFWHALARDVAYAELPRRARAEKHRSAARWLEAKAGERVADVADVLAHHYAAALDLARASKMDDLARELLDPSVLFLSLAGDRAMGLDVATAERHYSRALDLLPQRSARRPPLLGRWGEALHLRGRFREAAEASQEAAVELKMAGDISAAAAAMSRRALALDYLGDPGVREVLLEAVELVEGQPPSAETAAVFTQMAAELSLYDPPGTIEAAETAIALSEESGLPTPVRALDFLGGARCELGDSSGLNDQRRALQEAKAQGLGYEEAVVSFNLATSFALFSGLHAALRLRREGLETARPRGLIHMTLTLRMGLVEDLLWAGDWDKACGEIEGLLPDLEETEDLRDLLYVRACELLLLAWRGDFATAEPLLGWVEQKGSQTDDPRAFASCLLGAATVRLGLGDSARAVELLTLCGERPSAAGGSDLVVRMPQAMRTALAVGERSLAESLLSGIESNYPLSEHALAASRALLSEETGEHEAAASAFADAAARWRGFEVPYECGQALLGQGRCLVGLGKVPEAADPLVAAREIFARLGAEPALQETDRVLSAARLEEPS